jgi:hypothetical protein
MMNRCCHSFELRNNSYTKLLDAGFLFLEYVSVPSSSQALSGVVFIETL